MTKRVLVAEDDRVNRILLTTLLRNAGFDVLEAMDGEEALAVLRNEAVDCVLLDMNMPVVCGAEVVRSIRTLPEYASLKNVPVLGVSGMLLEDGQVKDLGLTDMMLKPFDADCVCQWVRTACSGEVV